MVSKLNNGVIIDDVEGLHAGINHITGDISLQAKGKMVKDGKIVKSLNMIILSTNINELLNNVIEVGSDLEEFDEYSEDDYEGRYRQKIIRVERLAKQYTATDYKQKLLEIRKEAKNRQLSDKELRKVNSECIKMIASNKFLLNN